MDKIKKWIISIWNKFKRSLILICQWLFIPLIISAIVTLSVHFLISKIITQYVPNWPKTIGFFLFTGVSVALLRLFWQFINSSLNKILTYDATTPYLRENLIKILANSAKNGKRYIEIDDTVRLLGDIAHFLDPENPKTEDEEEKFNDVIKQIKKNPVSVRSTDRRRPLEWAVDNNLQKLMVNFALHLSKPSGKLVFSKYVMSAISSCLKNYEKHIENEPLGHARRWVACENWDGKRGFDTDSLNSGVEKNFTMCVFRQYINPSDIKLSLAWIPEEGLPDRLPKIKALEENSPCKGKECKHRSDKKCIGVNISELFKVNEEECQNKSVFEACNLVRGPEIPTNLNGRLEKLLDYTIEIEESGGNPKADNFYRILLWDTDYFRSKQSETWIKFWDQIVKLPCFWIKPGKYPKLNRDIRNYFFRSNCDYIHIDNGTEVKAFKTYVEEGVPKSSVELKNEGADSEANDLNINFNCLLSFLNDPGEYCNILLAAHAYDLYKIKKNGE